MILYSHENDAMGRRVVIIGMPDRSSTSTELID